MLGTRCKVAGSEMGGGGWGDTLKREVEVVQLDVTMQYESEQKEKQE